MSVEQEILTIAAVVLGTMLTRFLPFLIFPEGRKPPMLVTELGTVLPYAVMGLLVVYCLKDAVSSNIHALPEALAIIVVAVLHHWKHNMFVSIAGGTVFYMVLLQLVFAV